MAYRLIPNFSGVCRDGAYIPAETTTVVNGRTYSANLGSVLTAVPEFDFYRKQLDRQRETS